MTHVLSELLQGEHAHTNPILCVDVSAEVAGRKPSPLPHSVFEFVWHMNYWMSHELERISGTPRPYPEYASLTWPAMAAPDGETWRKAQREFHSLLGRLQALAVCGPSERARVVLHSGPREGSRAYTVEEVVWQTAVHNSYHLGQVVLVRRALGVWPPKEGSDTW